MSKIQLQDFVEYGKLFEIYGKLLSEDRQKIMTDYFEFNMTLAEIAEQRQISRQAVLDALDKACKKIKEYENILHLAEVAKEKEKIVLQLEEIKTLALSKNQNEIAEKVDRIIKGM